MWLLLVGCIPEIDVMRPEDAPVAVLLEPAPGTTLDAGRNELRGMVSDAADAPERLFTTWQAGDAASTDAGGWETLCTGFAWEDGTTLCAADLRVDHTRLRLRVVDVAGFVGVAEVGVTVAAGASPALTLTSPDAGPWFSNVDVPLELVVSDLDDPVESLVVVGQSDLDGALPIPSRPSADGVVSARVRLSEGVHVLRVTAVDPIGRTGVVEQTVVVDGVDTPPVVRLGRERFVETPSGLNRIDGSVLDAQATPEEVAVSLWVGGLEVLPPGDWGGEFIVFIPGQPLGEHDLTLRAVDPNGLVGEAHATLLIDTPPEVTVWAAPLRISLGEPWVSDITVTDARSGPEQISVTLVSDLDGPKWTATPDAEGRVVRSTSLSLGSHYLTFQTTDGDGLAIWYGRTALVEE
jgi:hypothetical protein